jgi:hypothetical protein
VGLARQFAESGSMHYRKIVGTTAGSLAPVARRECSDPAATLTDAKPVASEVQLTKNAVR